MNDIRTKYFTHEIDISWFVWNSNFSTLTIDNKKMLIDIEKFICSNYIIQLKINSPRTGNSQIFRYASKSISNAGVIRWWRFIPVKPILGLAKNITIYVVNE